MSRLNLPSGNAMLPLLQRVYFVLTNDAPLTDLVPASSIGTNMRKSLTYPAIEFGVELSLHNRDRKETSNINITVYGTTSVDDVLGIADRVASLMSPKLLSDKPNNVYVGGVRRIRYVALPFDDYGLSVVSVFALRYTTLTPTEAIVVPTPVVVTP